MASAGRILIMPKGDYDASVTYEMLDLVYHNGSSWIARQTVVGIEPSTDNKEHWQQMSDFDLLDKRKLDRVEQTITVQPHSSHTITFGTKEFCLLFVYSYYMDYSCLLVCYGLSEWVYKIEKLSEKIVSGKLGTTFGTEDGKDSNTLTIFNSGDEVQSFTLIKIPF